MWKSVVLLILGLAAPTHAYNFSVESYYRSTTGLSGYALKSAIKEVIAKGHKDRGYDALIEVYFRSDVDSFYDQDGAILDIYSENPKGRDPYAFKNRSQVCGNYTGESNCFNREHLMPQSVFHKKQPMRNDFFQVYPTDGYVNNRRGSLPFGEVERPSWESENGSRVGSNSTPGYSGDVFEPIDEFKGDIARALLYFATRYEDQIAQWNHDMLDGSSDKVFKQWFLDILLEWHRADPVSPYEVLRNEVGFEYQGNRNPFVDNPEWVEEIWAN